MADLVMTIDSDSDVEVKNTSKKTKKKQKVTDQEDEILLAHSVIL